MEKIKNCFIFMVIILLLTMSITPVSALTGSTKKLDIYIKTLEIINDEYSTDFHIMKETEYYQMDCDEIWGMTYNQYIDNILNTDLEVFKTSCINIIKTSTIVDINITDPITRSTQSSKTVFFNNNYNKMTLKYKYTTKNSTKYFDTGYKPIASVTKVAVNNYFVMSSYSGSFKNSNRTYSVVAKGQIITYYGTSSKSFTVNFNI